METMSGSCRLGLWHVHVYWNGDIVSRIRFSRTGIEGSVPLLIRQYCAGKPIDLGGIFSVAMQGETPYSRIYRAVREIPYGKTATYGEIARHVGTSPRVVGQAMARNPTPLVIPCHRVVAATGIGGFSPDIGIKELLLEMEKKGRKVLLKPSP
ncbi:methylated-DNA--[protein]-cysteine S-methyltransferase [Methanoregula formicica]|uniref:O-6-methylguanine DNA methyltransferase n=1 Tax=Methanoregula formicica (strain DSM 22288 / NBRC 105244 / SMSP) TaxID=593750 RepID=L0HJE1_METFS|nr:methylated-DNA--[protein]-cysteine S-methyltransferase [Methanoregula formicica]AGB03164.1 O-6-methylguanine DNA methyltransferase [Methanoregula formicica SMSP]